MRILVMGGTRFLGWWFVERARDAGHEVTIFHRGRTPAPASVHEIVGDRTGDLSALPHAIDAVFDTCAYRASDVRSLAAALQQRGSPRYALVTSISVYAPDGAEWTESSPLLPPLLDDAEITGETYGPMKVACEHVARELFGASVLILRPGLIVGPRDTSNRFGYWPRRFQRPGPILAPGDGSQPVRFVDVRDLAAFALHALERDEHGVFNVDGPADDVRFRDLLAAIGGEPRRDVVWVDEAFLLERGVEPWTELPLWEGPEAGLARVSSARARAAGLTYTPLADTIAATERWESERPAFTSAALSEAKEAELLTAWRNR